MELGVFVWLERVLFCYAVDEAMDAIVDGDGVTLG